MIQAKCDFLHPGDKPEALLRPNDFKSGLCSYSTNGVDRCPYGREGFRMSRCTWAHVGDRVRFVADRAYTEAEYSIAVSKAFSDATHADDFSNGCFL